MIHKTIVAASIATACAFAGLTAPALAAKLPTYDVTANGTWDCRSPEGTFMGTVVLAGESYAWLKTDGRLGGYGAMKILSFDTDLPNFAFLSGPLKDEYGAGGGGMAGPRENFEDFSGELFVTIAVATTRDKAWYCSGRNLPDGWM